MPDNLSEIHIRARGKVQKKTTTKTINDGFMYVCVAEKCEMMFFVSTVVFKISFAELKECSTQKVEENKLALKLNFTLKYSISFNSALVRVMPLNSTTKLHKIVLNLCRKCQISTILPST